MRQQLLIYFHTIINKDSEENMFNCSKCGKKIDNPTRKLENSFFTIELYTCKKCHTTHKEAHYQNSLLLKLET